MKIATLIIAFFITLVASAQNETVTGKAYRFVKFYQDDNPFIIGEFIFKKKDKEIPNAYQLKYANGVGNTKELIFGIWIIDCGSFFYLNIYRYEFGFPKCFVRFEKKGNYYCFKAEPVMSASQEERLINSRSILGEIGEGITSHRITKENVNRWHHVLDFSNGSVQTLTEEYVTDILADYPQLFKEFNDEENKSSIKILKKYLELINNEW